MSSNIPQFSGRKPVKWSELEEKYKQDIEALTESAEMATIDKELAEEKLDSCEKELKEVQGKLAEARAQIETLKQDRKPEQPVGAGSSETTVTVLQLQKVEEQNEVLKQALIKVRDISAKDKQEIEDLRIEREELQVKLLDAEEKEMKYTEQIKVLEEQVDSCQSAQDMVEKLTQQKSELEDKLKDMIEDMDSMEKLRELNEQLIESARENEIDLISQMDKLRIQNADLIKSKRDIEDYLLDQERTVAKLKDENRVLSEQVIRLKEQSRENESIEQQKHQIENVAYKLIFSESKMADKEAEISRYKRNLSELEDQMNNMSLITKEQSARLDDLKLQYDLILSENAELQRALKKKMDEISELEIRKDMAENKVQSIQRDRETKISDLTRRIESMKGHEIQLEEDLRRLKEDNEQIECERRELRDQLNRRNRSLERSIQTVGNISMVTAQDTSLASLGVSFQSSPSVHSSPISHGHAMPQQPATHSTITGTPISASGLNIQQQHVMQPQTAISGQDGISSPPSSGKIANMMASSTPLAKRQLFVGRDMASTTDNGYLFEKIKELGFAFDQMSRKNYDLELELAYRGIENKPPPYDGRCGDTDNIYGFNLNKLYDIERAKSIQTEMTRLKREIRAAMINQKICTKSRNITSHVREERFNMSKLAMRCQALECEANNLLSNSKLTVKMAR